MNWAMPCAPAGLTANGLKPDSAKSWAASRAAETDQRWAARLIAGAKRSGTNSGSARPPSAPSAFARTVERGLRA